MRSPPISDEQKEQNLRMYNVLKQKRMMRTYLNSRAHFIQELKAEVKELKAEIKKLRDSRL
jgi:cell division protein FtsB